MPIYHPKQLSASHKQTAVRPLQFMKHLLALSVLVCAAHQAAAQESKALQIQPMTEVSVPEHIGYFGDPYPIHTAPWTSDFVPQSFSGTTGQVLECSGTIKAGCFKANELKFALDDSLVKRVRAAGNVFGAVINHNIYQMFDGRWQMAVTLYVHPAGNSQKKWTVIAHAHADQAVSWTPPTAWTADKILVGSLSNFDYANYDGKYFEDEGKLYLIYSKRLISNPIAHDGIVAQKMKSSTEISSEEPTVLLAPNRGDHSFNSEFFHTNPPAGDTFKLIETGNLIKIGNKVVMAYSVGDYQQRNYKTGLAYSDSLIPEEGQMYRKVLERDTAGVWGDAGAREVRYLLQSQKPDWPNYVADQVLAPGVPAIVQEQRSGSYILTFDGFLPGDTPPAPNTPNNPLNIEPDHRRPFFVRLDVNVPVNGSAEAATDEELASWITLRRK